jgi:hypothetical protein
MGEAAREFAKDFLAGVKTVRLERDHPREVRGRFARFLAYVLVYKNGRWLNYNIEAVRAGMSPYFTKYSYSRRFHREFVAAEKEARAARRGIWNPRAQAYRDYEERIAWWNARAEFVKTFEQEAAGREDHIVLTHWDAMRRIEAQVGKEVTVLATVSQIRRGENAPTRVMLSRTLFNDFPAVFFDDEVFEQSGLAQYKGEYVALTGVVNVYENKYTRKRQLQILVSLPSQVALSPVPGIQPLAVSE